MISIYKTWIWDDNLRPTKMLWIFCFHKTKTGLPEIGLVPWKFWENQYQTVTNRKKALFIVMYRFYLFHSIRIKTFIVFYQNGQ